MEIITRFLSDEIVRALGWTILHSLWQGLAVALILAMALLVLRNRPPQLRYTAGLLALTTLVIATVITFSLTYHPINAPEAYEIAGAVTTADEWADAAGPAILPAEAAAWPGIAQTFNYYFNRHLPLIVLLWLLGVLFLSLRTLGELAFIQHLRYNRSRPAGLEWQEKLGILASRIGLRRPVELRESLRINTPMVVGILRPVILAPVGLLANLPPEQVESALAHELAHIRRQDYLVNLLQSCVEILFFFNPGVWWISSFIRAEREHCCDDWAVALTGDELTFVRTLATLEEYRERHSGLVVALAGSRGSVLGRIQRILHGEQLSQLPFRIFWSIGALLIFMTAAAFTYRTAGVPEEMNTDQPEQMEYTPDTLPEDLIITRLDTVPPTGIASEDAIAEVPAFENDHSLFGTAASGTDQEYWGLQGQVTSTGITDTIPKSEQERRRLEKEFEAALIELDQQMYELQQQMSLKQEEMESLQNERRNELIKAEKETQQMANELELRQKETRIRENELRGQARNLEIERRRLQEEYTAEQIKEAPDKEAIGKIESQMLALSNRQIEMEKMINDLEIDRQKQALLTEIEVQKLENTREMSEKDLELDLNKMELEILKLRQQGNMLNVKRQALENEFRLKMLKIEEQ